VFSLSSNIHIIFTKEAPRPQKFELYSFQEQLFPFERSNHMKDNKTQLHEIIDTLSDKQILFILTFVKRILGKS